jgi:nitrate/TMAO reductase-like tetraheme cytochrome c subunit
MVKRKKRSSLTGFEIGSSVTGFKSSKTPRLKIPSSNLYPTQPKKYTRRAFTATQKKQILAQQDFKCAKCHKKLGVAYHFHHAKSWSSGGKTTVQNGRALCADCHEIISHKERLKQVDEKRKPRNTNPFF